MNEIPSSKESALLNLVEYAEDCPFPSLHLYVSYYSFNQYLINIIRFLKFLLNK